MQYLQIVWDKSKIVLVETDDIEQYDRLPDTVTEESVHEQASDTPIPL